MTIQEFAKGFDVIKKEKPFKGFNVWCVSKSRQKGALIGWPTFVLEKDGKFRFADRPKETKEINYFLCTND